MRIAGRLDRASTDEEVLATEREEVTESVADVELVEERSERSSMKLPAARLLGVRGRRRKSVIS